MHITGVVSVLPTPFRAGGEVDHPSLARLVDVAVAAGVQGLAVLGATGEASRMSERERLAVVETAVGQAAGRVPLFVDTSADGVRTCIDFSRQVRAGGASAAIISPPRAHRLSIESIVNHYRVVAEALDLPIIVHDAPVQCGVSMDAGLLVRIAREVPAARTILLDDPPTPVRISRVLAAAGETRIDLLGGQGGLFLLEDLEAGASGVASAFAYPEVLAQVLAHYRDKRVAEATELFHRFVPLMRFENQEAIGTAVRKEMLRRRGVFTDGSTRAPGFVLDEGMRAAVDRLLAAVVL
jgi:4-hydroxy-tetrahydrodipicolinate synthase